MAKSSPFDVFHSSETMDRSGTGSALVLALDVPCRVVSGRLKAHVSSNATILNENLSRSCSDVRNTLAAQVCRLSEFHTYKLRYVVSIFLLSTHLHQKSAPRATRTTDRQRARLVLGSALHFVSQISNLQSCSAANTEARFPFRRLSAGAEGRGSLRLFRASRECCLDACSALGCHLAWLREHHCRPRAPVRSLCSHSWLKSGRTPCTYRNN